MSGDNEKTGDNPMATVVCSSCPSIRGCFGQCQKMKMDIAIAKGQARPFKFNDSLIPEEGTEV